MGYRPSEERATLVAQAVELWREGLTQREIGRRLGVGRSTISNYLNHPEGISYSESHEDHMSGSCQVCGAACSHDAKRCSECHDEAPGWHGLISTAV